MSSNPEPSELQPSRLAAVAARSAARRASGRQQWLTVAAVWCVTIVIIGCMPRDPIISTGDKPVGVGGTIAGIVRSSGGGGALSGRKVTAVNLTTGEKIETSTAGNGGYTIKVPTGKYRLEVALQPGEVVTEQPADLQINVSDVDSSRNFVIGAKPPGTGL